MVKSAKFKKAFQKQMGDLLFFFPKVQNPLRDSAFWCRFHTKSWYINFCWVFHNPSGLYLALYQLFKTCCGHTIHNRHILTMKINKVDEIWHEINHSRSSLDLDVERHLNDHKCMQVLQSIIKFLGESQRPPHGSDFLPIHIFLIGATCVSATVCLCDLHSFA